MNEKIVMQVVVISVAMLVLLGAFRIVFYATSSTPYPRDLNEPLKGFGNSVVSKIYDGMCSGALDMNSAIWTFYSNAIARMIVNKVGLGEFPFSLNGLVDTLCQTHSNSQYSTTETSVAIRDPEDFKTIFVYEVQRCWEMYEGKTKEPQKYRNPIGSEGIRDCAEIIYDFPEGESVSLAELYARLSLDSVNAPVRYNSETGEWSDNVMWCAPREKMEDYWYNGGYFNYPDEVRISGASVLSLKCPDSGISRDKLELNSCLHFSDALCSFGGIEGYSNGVGDDESAVIDGRGRIVISYYDYFDWGGIVFKQRSSDNYITCGGNDVFNNFEKVHLASLSFSNYLRYDKDKKNAIVICYERYGDSNEG